MSAGKEPLPDRPHVIVVPPGLVSQWQMELHRFLPPRSFMILPYLGQCNEKNRKSTWDLVSSTQAPKILLVAHSAVLDDGKTVLNTPAKLNRQNEFTELGLKKGAAQGKQKFTLFNPAIKYGVVIVDEIHTYRGRPVKRLYLSALVANAFNAIGMSATPIITSPMVRSPFNRMYCAC